MSNHNMQIRIATGHFVIDKVLIIISLLSLMFCAADGRTVINFQPMEMDRGEILNYFQSTYLNKLTTFDKINEEVYQSETFSEDLFNSIDNLIPRRIFIKLLLKTKNITDKVDARGNSLASSYLNEINGECSLTSVFNFTATQILQSWDGDRSIVANDIDRWHDANRNVPHNQLCNRFRGLTCQFKIATSPDTDQGLSFDVSDKPTCQCSGNSVNVGFYKNLRSKGKPNTPYGDGCYIRPWRSCRHLSLDNSFTHSYYPWHNSMDNYKRQLVQMAYPVGKIPRCKEGTYCLDLIPDMGKPICWCNQNSYDPECIATAKDQLKRVAVGSDLSRIRTAFMKIIINSNDTKTRCTPEHNEKIRLIANSLGKDPRGGKNIVETMNELAFSQKKVQICDFRQALLCDELTKTCKGKLTCDPGKVHLGQNVCAVNNGFRCQSHEECVENARCRNMPGTMDSVCVCDKGYGNKCELEHRAFFMNRFLPIISGFEGNDFISLQVEVNNVIEAWEDNFKQTIDEPCDSTSDSVSMEIVKYFGNLLEYNKDLGNSLMKKVTSVLKEGPKMCDYTKFLRCDQVKQRCVPILGSYVVHAGSTNLANPGKGKIAIEIEAGKECVLTVPLIFEAIVTFKCIKGYKCNKSTGTPICTPDCTSSFAPVQQCPEPKDDIETSVEVVPDSTLGPRNVPLEFERKTNETMPGLSGRANSDLINTLGNPATLETEGITITTTPSSAVIVRTPEQFVTPMEWETETTTKKKVQNTGKLTPQKTSVNTIKPHGNASKPAIAHNGPKHRNQTKKTNPSKNKPFHVPPKPITQTASKQRVARPPPKSETDEDNLISESTRKARFGEECMYDDYTTDYPSCQKIDICDRDDYLVCSNEVCECHAGLIYSETHNKCAIPIGEKCQESSKISLPSYMDKNKLPCEGGECKQDGGGHVCKRQTNMRSFIGESDDENKFDGDEDRVNEARRISQSSLISIIGMLLLVVMI